METADPDVSTKAQTNMHIGKETIRAFIQHPTNGRNIQTLLNVKNKY